MQADLEVHTDWIRQAAATLDSTSTTFASAGSGAVPELSSGSLGTDDTAAAATALIGLRSAQALQAATQLSRIAAGLAEKLRTVADGFDRLDLRVPGIR